VERSVLRFSRLGEHGGLWLAASLIGFAFDRQRRPQYSHALRAVLGAYALNTGIKYVLRRPRPVLEGLPPLTPTVSRLSYPSAHASTSFAGAQALGRVWPSAPLHATAGAMAMSRPYLGVHYPSDVLAGAALGWAVEKLVP
jgi:undecaprenyl-diphosphatase